MGTVSFWGDEMFWSETEVVGVQHCEQTKCYRIANFSLIFKNLKKKSTLGCLLEELK